MTRRRQTMNSGTRSDLLSRLAETIDSVKTSGATSVLYGLSAEERSCVPHGLSMA
jgi:hypothetical protein